MAQLVEHILGKDEVSSSNLDSSSMRKHLEVLGLRGVFLCFSSAAGCCILLFVDSAQNRTTFSPGTSIAAISKLLYN